MGFADADIRGAGLRSVGSSRRARAGASAGDQIKGLYINCLKASSRCRMPPVPVGLMASGAGGCRKTDHSLTSDRHRQLCGCGRGDTRGWAGRPTAMQKRPCGDRQRPERPGSGRSISGKGVVAEGRKEVVIGRERRGKRCAAALTEALICRSRRRSLVRILAGYSSLCCDPDSPDERRRMPPRANSDKINSTWTVAGS